jgi:sugar lactone lactonase YvrE
MFLSAVHKSNPLASGGAVFAGSLTAQQGNSNDTGSNARFYGPSRIVADSNGNFYVSDTSNHSIRKVTRFGVVTTVFGTGSSGSSLTTLNSPRGLALDSSNNLYIADFSNSRIICVSNGLTLGSNATLVASNVYNPDEIAVNSNGSNIVIKTTATSGQNLIQYRNGTVDGLINTSQNSSVPNVASVTSTPSGEFYYSTRNGQTAGYQISAYKMYLNPPTTYVLAASNITQPNGIGGLYPVFLSVSVNPTSVGFSIGQTFRLSEFSSSSVNGFVGTILNFNQSASSNITFKYPGPLQNYPIGTPNPEAFITNSDCNVSSNFRVLAVGWDTVPVVGSNLPGTDSPGSVLRMNFYLGNATYDFPSFAYFNSSPTPRGLPGTTTLGGFTDLFTIWNDQTLPSPVLFDFPFPVTVGGSGALSFTNTLTGIIYSPYSAVGGYILGPGVEAGTIITAYTLVSGQTATITTNKAFAFLGSGTTTTIRITGPSTKTNVHTFDSLSTSALLIPGIRIEGDAAFGATILEVELDFSDRSKGTIRTDFSFTATVNGTYTARSSYVFAPWPGGSRRVVTTTFPAVGFPTGGSGTGKVTTTLINNNPTPLLTDGVYYGTFLKAMQFSKIDNNLLYAANQGYEGITQYSITGDTLIASDKNADILSVDSFAVFPSTSEIIAVVPQPTTNNLQIYQNEY